VATGSSRVTLVFLRPVASEAYVSAETGVTRRFLPGGGFDDVPFVPLSDRKILERAGIGNESDQVP